MIESFDIHSVHKEKEERFSLNLTTILNFDDESNKIKHLHLKNMCQYSMIHSYFSLNLHFRILLNNEVF